MRDTEVPPTDWFGGQQAHIQAALETEAAQVRLPQIHHALDLLGSMLVSSPIPGNLDECAPNDFSAVACFVRAFGALQAATAMCMHGYYSDARATLRCSYEAAGLARMLAKSPALAEKWLRKGTWIPDKDVREYIESQVVRAGEESPYRAFYRMASAAAHPSARTAVPLALDRDGHIRLKLLPEFDAQIFSEILHEIAIQGTFVCFAFKRAATNESALPPSWHKDLADLASEVTGRDMDHLVRDWEIEERRYDEMLNAIVPANELADFLRAHPNSDFNIQRRVNPNVGHGNSEG